MFIGVSFIALADRIVAIGASDGSALFNFEGITSDEALAFLYSLKNGKEKANYVAYDFAVDLELLFRNLTPHEKDVFFGIIAEKEESAKGTPLYQSPPETKVNHAGFEISCFAGKIFRLAIPKRSPLTLYDISAYFEGCDVSLAAKEYLGESLLRIQKEVLPLWQPELERQIIDRAILRASITQRLAEKVDDVITPLEINPRAWYGPSAIAGACLNKWGARKQSRRLSEGNSPAQLVSAIDRALFGGRVEAIKLGLLHDISTYDLNSAYAYAITLLSQFYSPLRFTRQYERDHPFALWLVDYELPAGQTLGILPTRRGSHGGIYFGSRGKGYFWAPEVDYLLTRFPGCADVKFGYYTPEYKPVAFADDVRAMYSYRLKLKEKGDKGEKIVKLALSNLYGKFAQNKGVAYYQCRAWAGWITSLVRRLMLEAVSGIEDQVISFNQDAIHITGKDCEVLAGSALGQWKFCHYSQGLYLAPGIYELSGENDQLKSASRGSNLGLDFAKIAGDLSDRGVSELQRQFFVGWQMARTQPLKYEREYLKDVVETLDLIPANLKARHYETMFDWNTENRDSTISRRFSGLLSARYIPQTYQSALRLQLKDQGWQ